MSDDIKNLVALYQDQAPTIESQQVVDGLTDGEMRGEIPFMTERTLSKRCGVSETVIDSISQDWNVEPPSPRIAAIKKYAAYAANGYLAPRAYVTATWRGLEQRCYLADVFLGILYYFALDAGPDCQAMARETLRHMRGTPTRVSHNSQAGGGPPGFFNPDDMPFGLDLADLGRAMDRAWAAHWEENNLGEQYGERTAESYSGGHVWSYPVASREAFRLWAQHEYFTNGPFEAYLNEKVERGEIPPALAAQALTTILRGTRMGSA